MNRFYLVSDRQALTKVYLHHENCLAIAARAATHILSTDIEAWRDKAAHLHAFQVNPQLHILCLDFEKLLT